MGQTPSNASSIDESEVPRQAKMRRRLPVELIAEVAHWLLDSECAELDPVSANFNSFTNARALKWLAIKV